MTRTPDQQAKVTRISIAVVAIVCVLLTVWSLLIEKSAWSWIGTALLWVALVIIVLKARNPRKD